MKTVCVAIACVALLQASFAQEPIYRCGREYTNAVPKGKEKECKRVDPPPMTPEETRRFQDCLLEAAKAPTESGVRLATHVCEQRALKTR